jgi:hypothetical protein
MPTLYSALHSYCPSVRQLHLTIATAEESLCGEAYSLSQKSFAIVSERLPLLFY